MQQSDSQGNITLFFHLVHAPQWKGHQLLPMMIKTQIYHLGKSRHQTEKKIDSRNCSSNHAYLQAPNT